MTSSILPPRRLLAPCSPSTQAIASTTLDLPDPLGPTTAVMPGSSRRVVGDAKDLKPFSVRLDRCTVGRLPEGYDSSARNRSPHRAARALRQGGGRSLVGHGEQLAGDRGVAL